MNDEELDQLLGAPLVAVNDADFSRRVSARVIAFQQRGMFVELLAAAAAIALFSALVPLKMLNGPIEALALNLGSSLPVAVAFAALALSYAYTRTADGAG